VDFVGATDEVKFYYDTQGLPTGAPSYTRGAAVGRLVAQTYGSGTSGDYYAYDELGRATLKIQRTGSIDYQMSATYNLSGALATLTYPSNHAVTNSYDQAGRLSAFSGNLGDATTRTYSTGIEYDAPGNVRQEQFGTQTPLYLKKHYNKRGQLFDIRLSTMSWATDQWNWNRGALVNYYSSNYAWEGDPATPAGPDNNGNVLRQQHWVPADDDISSYNYTQDTYAYDSLNRIQSATEAHGTAAGQSGQDYAQLFIYDRWGNRTINPTSWGTGINSKQFTIAPCNSVSDPCTNRLQVPVGQTGVMDYDAAGNLTNDTYTGAGNRTYDAENKIVSAWGGNNQAQLYAYDASGQRIKRTVDGVTSWQVYGFGGELLAEYSANGPATSPNKEYGYRNGQLLITAEPAPPSSPAGPDFAAAGNGAVATASSTISSAAPAANAINGDHVGSSGWWADNTSFTYPDWLQVDFSGSKTISEIDVYGVQQNYGSPVEPTPTLTSSYALTNFEVQYWTGSAWATVPGASVSGNDKVWRKFTFTPLTTSKIRVYITNVAGDNHSQIVELEAYTASANATIHWLVTDHLGTPRMIIDQSGNLANMKRHDYLPFGEELFAGVGGRTTAQGYAGGDAVRQQFTQKERDIETGLDYFLARYYSSTQGRFTSPDEFSGGPIELFTETASANPTFYSDLRKPQSLNKYQYAYNNPLRYTDPDGHDPDGEQDVVKINVNPPVILSVRVSVIDKLPNGSVPVGGEFEISYKYRTSLPQNGAKPEDLGRIEGIDYAPTKQNPAGGVPKSGGTFADSNNLGTVGDPKVKVDVGKEAVTVEKTERFIVKPRPDSKPGASGAINYKIVVTNPNNGATTTRSSKGPDTLFKQSLPYIPVQNVPKPPKKKKDE
jgi:RHS repeat-associated protein